MAKEAVNTMLYGGRIGLGEYLVINDENYRWELSNAIVYSFYKRGESIKLSELIYHPELFSASPLLKDVNVFFENANENSGRVENLERIFSSKNLSDVTVYLTLNFSHYESTRTEFRTIESSEPDLAKESILLHELQHILQAIHNRPSGTTVLAGRIEANATLAALKNKAVLRILTADEEYYYKYYSYIDSRNELESLFYYSDDGEMEARRAVRHWLNSKGIEYIDPLQEYFGHYEFNNGGMITHKTNGGGYQYSGDEMQRAKKVDLLTLPKNVLGTNCGNCLFQSDGFCNHKEICLPVTPRMCCALWDNAGATRSWDNKPEILQGSVGMFGDGGEIILNNARQQAIDDEIIQDQFGTQELI